MKAGQLGLATDFDRNRNAMIDAGRLRPDTTRVVWQSDPLPNDALAVSRDFPVERTLALQQAVVALPAALAVATLPPRHTGWIGATHESYRMIEEAGRTLGRLRGGAV